MSKPVSVSGLIILSNGEEVQFIIGRDGAVSRWGNTVEHLGSTVEITEAMSAAAVEFFPSEDDDNDE